MPEITPVPALRFSLDDVERAADEWGCNCGPTAVAAVLGMTLDEIRPHLGDFEQKRYTNPTLMWEILRKIKAEILKIKALDVNVQMQGRRGYEPWPSFGLARVQWEGPWTAPGVPMRVRYRHTHWVGVSRGPEDWTVPGWEGPYIFDVNCMCAGGWIPLCEWVDSAVPWLLGECEPKANGKWHLTHVVEVAHA